MSWKWWGGRLEQNVKDDDEEVGVERGTKREKAASIELGDLSY